MDDIRKNIMDKLDNLFNVIDEALANWTGTDNLQFPVLLGMLAVKCGWNEKQVRENDPVVRYYIRDNPNWYVTRGAKGGIMKASEKQKKESFKAAKEVAKQQVQEALTERLKATALSTKMDPPSEDIKSASPEDEIQEIEEDGDFDFND